MENLQDNAAETLAAFMLAESSEWLARTSATTAALNRKNVGDTIPDFAGPLGKPTEVEGLKKVCVVGGGVGCAIALPFRSRPQTL